MDLYLPFEKTVLTRVIEILDDTEINLGLKISYDKTILYRIGSLANSDAKIFTQRNIKWSNEAINTLGVDLYLYQNLPKNFEKVILKMQTVMNMWYYRSLSLIGKVLILNALIGSLFVYKMQVISNITEDIFLKAKQHFEYFLWNGLHPKISYNILIRSKDQGGLGLVDLKLKHNALLIKWVKLSKNHHECTT